MEKKDRQEVGRRYREGQAFHFASKSRSHLALSLLFRSVLEETSICKSAFRYFSSIFDRASTIADVPFESRFGPSGLFSAATFN